MNIVYRMAGPRNLDALIVLSNTVGNFGDPASVARLVAATGLPAISIGFDLEGLACASACGVPAMSELVLHLARVHGKRKFALVAGPRLHSDSIEREAAFRDTLAREGLSFDERLFFQGKFFKESGSEAVRAFLDSGIGFDALVCLNDFMAMGALAALRERGIAVPGDVSVTGFDDIGEARWTSPPLTTIHQPIEVLARSALDMALELLGGETPASRVLECRCVYRQSCGCPPDLPLADSGLAAPEDLVAEDLERLNGIRRLAEANDVRGILKIVDGALNERTRDRELPSRWRRLLYGERSRRRAVPAPGIDWFDQALALINETELRWEVERNIEIDERDSLMRDLGMRLLGTFSFDALVRQWESCIRLAGISRSYLVLFEAPVEPGGAALPERSRLVAADPAPGCGLVQRVFPTGLLLPPELGVAWGKAGWIIEPLVYQDEALGYLLVERGSEEPIVYESLRDQLSTAVKATLLMEEIKEHKRSLERQVELRTRELRNTNKDLKAQIAQRRILEREVQEVSNRTMQAIGQDLHDDICQHLVGISMLAAVAEETSATTGNVSADSIREMRDLLESAVSRLRQFARTLYPPGLEAQGLVSALEDLVESQRHTAGAISISFQVEGDCRVDDPGRALQLYRIVQEALSNALRHSGSEVVLLRLFRKREVLVAEVRDFGRGLGLDSAMTGQGMGMRIMRYRADSIGALLDVHDIEPGVCVSCTLER
jgi:signal transduction histidine kinase